VSPSEHAQVLRAAAKRGLSGSTFIRMILLEQLAREAGEIPEKAPPKLKKKPKLRKG
jgi:hypothetical protein